MHIFCVSVSNICQDQLRYNGVLPGWLWPKTFFTQLLSEGKPGKVLLMDMKDDVIIPCELDSWPVMTVLALSLVWSKKSILDFHLKKKKHHKKRAGVKTVLDLHINTKWVLNTVFQLSHTPNAFHIDYFHQELRLPLYCKEMHWQIYWVSPPHQNSTLKAKYSPKMWLKYLHVEE